MVIIVAIFLFFIAFMIWWIYGKDEKIQEEDIWEALKNTDIFDASLAYDGITEDNDVVAIFLHILNKKLIIFKNKHKLFTDHNYKGATHLEVTFIEELFGKNNEIYLKDSKDRFCKAAEKLKNILNEEKRKKKIFILSSLTKGKFVFIILTFILALAIFNPLVELMFFGNALVTLFLAIIFILVGMGLCYIVKEIGLKHVTISFFAIIILGLLCFELGKILLANPQYILEFVICVILAGLTYGMLKSITKRNTYGNKVYNKLISIKKYMELQQDILLDKSLLPFVYLLNIKKEYSFFDEETKRMNDLAIESMNILNPQGIIKNKVKVAQDKNNGIVVCEEITEKEILKAGDKNMLIRDNEGKLFDFNGEAIKIKYTGVGIPVEAELKYENGKNILHFIVKICFCYHLDTAYSQEQFEQDVINGIKLWEGEYEVFGGQKVTVNIDVVSESVSSSVEFLLVPTNADYVNIIPIDEIVINNLGKILNKQKLGCLDKNAKDKRSFVLSPQGWSVESERFMCLFSKDNVFSDSYVLKQVVKHEFGHVLGLGDLYEETDRGLNGVKEGTYSELDGYHLENRKYDLVMCRSDGDISNNDIEMIILAFSKNEEQNYQTMKNKGKISEALGKGN